MHQISIICLWVGGWNIRWMTARKSGIAVIRVSGFRLSWSIFVDSLSIAGRSEPSRLSVGRLSDQSQRLPAGHGAAHCRQTAPITPVTHCRNLPTLREIFFFGLFRRTSTTNTWISQIFTQSQMVTHCRNLPTLR